MKMKMKKIVLLMTVMMMCGANAYAASKVEVSILAEKEITVMEKGKQVIKRVKAENVIQGDVVFYTLSMINQGDEAATNIALVDPIPDNTVYLNGTAFGAGSDISYSVDGGQHYQKPNLLTYMVKGEKRVASSDRYTHIRWLVKELPAGKMATAGFQVRVK